MESTAVRYRDPYNMRHSCACRILEAGMKLAYCARILGHSVQTFLTTYARFIDADADAEQASIWATIEWDRTSSGAKMVPLLI
jgi:integrase